MSSHSCWSWNTFSARRRLLFGGVNSSEVKKRNSRVSSRRLLSCVCEQRQRQQLRLYENIPRSLRVRWTSATVSGGGMQRKKMRENYPIFYSRKHSATSTTRLSTGKMSLWSGWTLLLRMCCRREEEKRFFRCRKEEMCRVERNCSERARVLNIFHTQNMRTGWKKMEWWWGEEEELNDGDVNERVWASWDLTGCFFYVMWFVFHVFSRWLTMTFCWTKLLNFGDSHCLWWNRCKSSDKVSIDTI